MDTIKVLDVSLRDGGYRTNFHFTNNDLQEILRSLDNSGLEYIEIGYRNGPLAPIENCGKAGCCGKDYLLFCQSLIKNAKIAVMVYPQNVIKSDLEELKACRVALLRICVPKGEVQTACPIIDTGNKLGLETSVNFMNMSYYNEKEMDEAVAIASSHYPDMIYFADSNGSMFPTKIQAIFHKYTKQYAIPFGFHAHDNLGLAQANALAALSNGVQYIDVSLAGMGKGIGNLKTEFFTAYLHAIDIKKYSLPEILMAANYVRKVLRIGHEDIEIYEFFRGISGL
jgi:4-hydroxy 2-oxovalerate aldolase